MIIEAKAICKSFGPLQVLKGIDFSAEKGEVVSIMGASGAGKSTLLQILGTLSTPDSGSLVLDGQTVFGNPGAALGSTALADFRNRRIGFVFQFHHLLPEFTALENVMIPAFIAGKTDRQAREKALQLLTEVGLEGRTSHKPSELSGGEQQRVAIARALLNAPGLIVADEPTGNLDSDTAEGIMQLLTSINRGQGTTVMMVTHNTAFCERYPGRIFHCENESCRELISDAGIGPEEPAPAGEKSGATEEQVQEGTEEQE